ncbi:MAG: NAD(P)H-dependent oxidoreductase subunit E [Candidatus Sabulitectum sp.]|nr:NAD(P)H-dependent oxidoreductase subunit E [Candidatus Sabulitectum sp.]
MARNPQEIVADSISEFGNGRERIMQILTRVNNELSYVPSEAIEAIADATGVSAAEVYSVVTFYSFFSTEPRGRNIVRLCSTISCAMAGQGEVLDALIEEFGIEPFETTEDYRLTIETTPCIGLCDQAPAMLVNGEPHVKLTPEKACEIVRGLE